jgi:hypothetical protein
MKLTKLSLLVLLIACPWAIRAQTSADQTIVRLKSEIARREAIDRDTNTPDSLKAMNRRLLDRRRAELIDAIQAKVNAVQKYLEALGPAATEEEKQAAAKSLREAANNTNGVYDSNRTAARARFEQPASTDAAIVASSFVTTNAETAATSISTEDAPFEITSPPDAHSTGVSEIEVTVKLKSGLALGFDIVFKVVVKDKDGKEIDKQDLKIEGTKTFAKSDPLNLAEGDNTIEVTQGGKKVLRKVNYKPAGRRAGGTSPDTEQKGSIKITSAKSIQVDKREAKISVKNEKREGDDKDKTIVIEVTNDNKKVDQGERKTSLDAKAGGSVDFTVKIQQGVNKVIVRDKNKTTDSDSAEITCTENCATANGGFISIDSPAPGETFPTSFYQASLTIEKEPTNPIQKLKYYVLRDGVSVVTPSDVDAVDVKYKDNEPAKVVIPIKFVEGRNEVTFFDPDHKDDKKYMASIVVNCEGPNCAKDFLVSTIPTNSQNTRVGVGLEQVGGSSAESKTKPFLDFFFTTPFWYDKKKKTELVRTEQLDANGAVVKDRAGNPIPVYVRRPVNETVGKVPRMGAWGHVRLTATPEQLTATSILPSTLANRVAQTGTSANLVQSFDFLAGLQGRLFTGNGSFLSLIPGIRQKTRFYLAAGYGAVSPLDATKENTQFFLIPQATSSQRALFEERFGTPPQSATHVALVPLDRDRFYRQWYAGLRLQTFFCEGEDENCTRFRNSFPAITDVMIGQSQSVTGGSFKRTDANGKTKQAFVLKIEAFYPLPIREARFIYLYGTAIMKIGGDVKVISPLLLDPATSIPNINDPLVYIPPVDLLRSQQPNRDYYKIGVGINLTDLFNRNKTPPQ